MSSSNAPEQLPPEHGDLLRMVFEANVVAALIDASIGSVSIELLHGQIRTLTAAVRTGFSAEIVPEEGLDDGSLHVDSGYGHGGTFGWSDDLNEVIDHVADFARRFGTQLADDLWAIEHRNHETPLDQ